MIDINYNEIEDLDYCLQLLDKRDKEIERLNNNWQQSIEDLSRIANELELEEGSTIYDILDKLQDLKGSDKE